MELASCPFCGETKRLDVLDIAVDIYPAFAVTCDECQASGPIDDTREQAIANWNRRPTSTLTGVITMDQAAVGVSSGTGMALPDACPIGNFDPIDGKWDGEGDLRVTWWNRGVVDGLRTARRVAEENGDKATVAAIEKSIDHHSAVLARMLDTGAATGDKRFGDVILHTRLLSPGEEDRRIAELRAAGVAMIDGDKMGGEWTCGPGDDLAHAREKRDLAGLPSIETAAEPDGLSMEFDLGGGPKPKR